MYVYMQDTACGGWEDEWGRGGVECVIATHIVLFFTLLLTKKGTYLPKGREKEGKGKE